MFLNMKIENYQHAMRITPILLLTFLVVQNTFAQLTFTENIITDERYATEDPVGIYPVDFDGDGDLDVLTAFETDDKVVWYENRDGQGDYGQQILISDEAARPKDVYYGDLDGDGDQDVVSASWDDDKVAWYENFDGQGTFGPQQVVVTLDQARAVRLADFDGDGDLDLIAGSLGEDLNWYENDGMANFGPPIVVAPTVLGQTDGLVIGDVDGDGDLDIVKNSIGRLSWHENLDGLGDFGGIQIIQENLDEIAQIDLKDLDSDGDNDIAISVTEGNIIGWYENTDGLGGFGFLQIIAVDAFAFKAKAVQIGDIDGDGDNDVVAGYDISANNSGKIVWYENSNGAGNFLSEAIIREAESNTFVNIADIDGDGDLDVLNAAQPFELGWIPNLTGNGDFGLYSRIDTNAHGVNDVRFADIDGDGDQDVIAAYDVIAWYENLDGQGTYGVSRAIGEGDYVYAADIDGDGDQDVLSNESITGDVVWYENLDGQGDFGPEQLIDNSNFGGGYVFADDLDNDGDMDVISLTPQDELVFWFENLDGLGTFGPLQVIWGDPGFGPFYVQTADFDSDGDKDVIAYAFSNEKIAWFENIDGSGTFGPTQLISDPADEAQTPGFGDIDGDGDIDVVSASDADDTIIWYENIDGQGTFSSKQILTSGTDGFKEVYVQDLDSDGDLDIVDYTFSDDKISWYQNLDGQANFSEEFIISINVNQSIRNLDFEDVNSDGRLDIVACSSSDDKVNWYENEGLTTNRIFGQISNDYTGTACAGNNPTPNIQVQTTNGSETLSTFSYNIGLYNLYPGEGNFVTSVISELPTYYTVTPASENSNFVGVGNIDEVNFCIESSAVVDDLNIAIYPVGFARPGFESSYLVSYTNIGTTILEASVSLAYDDASLDFLTASETVTSQTNGNLFFENLGEIFPFETKTILVEFEVEPPPVVETGDILSFVAVVDPQSNDATPVDNTKVYDQIVVNSFDPNDIQVIEGEEIFEEQVDDYLHYIIRFQNTGTASAINVRIENELDSNLDPTTMIVDYLSHTGIVTITNGNEVEFSFVGINLPPSSQSEELSQGYIAYRIKPASNVGLGDSMSNVADIFFDFNPPITTNTVTTTVIEDLSSPDFNISDIKIYPVPAGDLIQIRSTEMLQRTRVLSGLGQVLIDHENKDGIESIDVSGLRSGMYFLELTNDQGAEVETKIIKL